MQRLLAAIAALVIPLALLLAAQWPLRQLIQAYAREANDLAQIVFALYMAVAVAWAGYRGVHLAARPRGTRSRWRAMAIAACVVPWAVFLLATASGPAWQSVRGFEKFADSFNPGFFLIKAALVLLALLVLLEAAVALRKAGP